MTTIDEDNEGEEKPLEPDPTDTEETERERVSCTVLGKNIGTTTGWDELATLCVHFYNFIPDEFGWQFLGLDESIYHKTRFLLPLDAGLTIDYPTGRVLYSQYEVNKPKWSLFNK